MSDHARQGASEYRHHDATPGSAADRSLHAGVRDSFPASDPLATTATVGSRAVDPSSMMPGAFAEPDGGRTVTIRFADPESAKLAAERLVRDVPLDRRAIAVRDSELAIAVTGSDIARLCRVARACNGELRIADQIAELRETVDSLMRNRALPAVAQAAQASRTALARTGQAAAAGSQRTAAVMRRHPYATAGMVAAATVLALAWPAIAAGRPSRRRGMRWQFASTGSGYRL